jgi:ribosomal protein S1
MAKTSLLQDIQQGKVVIPNVKAGAVVNGKVIKRGDYGVLVDCFDGAFTGLILAKEVKNLERNNVDL